MKMHTVTGGGGLKLHVREWGPEDAPALVLIHGWSQHHLCWTKQLVPPLTERFRVVAFDLRGHGMSEAPLEPETYTAGAHWAEDVHAVIATLKLDRPVLAGWSYGGCVIGDYLRVYGDGAIAGINFAGAAVRLGEEWAGTLIGPGFLDHVPGATNEDQAVALPAIREFLHGATAMPLAPEEYELAMGWNMLVHPRVRAALLMRELDFTPELARLGKPALVSYGEEDTLVLPAMAKLIHKTAPGSEISAYPGVSHAPFLEEPERFNAELAAFAEKAQGGG